MVSVVRKVIKEEQSDSNMEVETDDKEGFKDIVKAADDFASRVGSGKGVDKDKIHKGKGKGDSLKEKNHRSKARAKEIPRAIPREESPHSETKKMERVQKNVVSPGKTWREEYRQRWKEKHGKKWFERKKQRRQEWRQNKKGSKVTSTDVERLFTKLMKGANEEDWNCLGQF